MNLRFVEAFYWVATLKSVSRAAEKLSITQSAMSSRVAGLEEELGTMLLDRRDKQFKLTVAGTRFLHYAEKLLALQRELKEEMGSGGFTAAAPVLLRIGSIESVLHSWLMPWIEKLRADLPMLELELSVETTPMLQELVRRGTLDLVFAAAPASHEGVRVRTLASMEMAFVGNPTVHKRSRYSLEQLAQHDLLTFQRGSQPHVALMDLFRRDEIAPPRVHTISSISAMTQLVEAGFGIATLPRAAAERLRPNRALKILGCEHELLPLPVFASFRPDPQSRQIEAVVDAALAFANEAKHARVVGRSAK
ncbi:LysR family transcriptional regulator [Rhizobacter sp. J219]|jgi:DNA-binding transcriptional LysR family regulator|uniref:LysR family transcriptional regulator n=1 Tax=Rhizobacter sp. J219 TaxID=2898430 RepID=UPI0021508C0B|nr:LysR family transcriptional regulator [Rhizobacter sp. J219]MCR5885174.1 LysR family transcriptional regulator [Rhizobacter sp. J219]